jgi:CRISPR-associated protein (TIGR02584 family)
VVRHFFYGLFFLERHMRDVLIALCGLTPQVVTETLWALAQQRPPVVPQEVRIVATRSGKEACERLLFGKQGKLASYLREYPVSRAIRCSPKTMTILKGSDGWPLGDLRTQEDNLAVADQLAEVIRNQTALADVRLHCSVAGGRKSMGVLLAAVLQVYGRPEDRLYHVLVPPEFESQPEFFYIPKRPRLLTLPNGKRLDTRKARIELAEVPYIRLRAFLPEDLLKESLPFTDLVTRAQNELRSFERPELVKVQPDTQRLLIGKATIDLSPLQSRLYTAFARIKTENCTERARKTCGECTACYQTISKGNWDSGRERLENLVGDRFLWPADLEDPGVAPARFRTLVTKTNNAVKEGLGSERLAERYHIRSDGPRGETRYGLAVDKTLIRVES